MRRKRGAVVPDKRGGAWLPIPGAKGEEMRRRENYELAADLEVRNLPCRPAPSGHDALDTRPAEMSLWIEPLMIEITRDRIRVWRYTGKK